MHEPTISLDGPRRAVVRLAGGTEIALRITLDDPSTLIIEGADSIAVLPAASNAAHIVSARRLSARGRP